MDKESAQVFFPILGIGPKWRAIICADFGVCICIFEIGSGYHGRKKQQDSMQNAAVMVLEIRDGSMLRLLGKEGIIISIISIISITISTISIISIISIIISSIICAQASNAERKQPRKEGIGPHPKEIEKIPPADLVHGDPLQVLVLCKKDVEDVTLRSGESGDPQRQTHKKHHHGTLV
jgi:hypothetical protein